MYIGCEIIRDLLPLYADNVCSEESRELIENHCSECRECRERLESMRIPLPRRNDDSVPKDPLKKARRHYIRLALVTAAVCTVIAVPLLTVGKINLNEELGSGNVSWSSISAKREVNDFGRLMMQGKYREAMDTVGFKGLDKKYYGGRDMDGIREDYANALGVVFDEYGITSVNCDGKLYAGTGIVKGTCYLWLDKSNTKGIPMVVALCYEYYGGMAYIDEIYTYPEPGDIDGEIALEVYRGLCGEKLGRTAISNYPGEYVTNRLDRYLRGERSWDTLNFITSRELAYREASAEFSVKPYDEHTEKEREAWEETIAEHTEYTEEREKLLEKFFSEDYLYISLEGGMAEYCAEPIFKSLKSENSFYERFHCYKQPVTINMQTADGEAFTVSFVMKCNFAAELPFENITYSDNTPSEFRAGFEELFY